jgi:hypothetical protein
MLFFILESSVYGNYSGGYGGGVAFTNTGGDSATGRATAVFRNSTFSANVAVQDGGGLWVNKYNPAASPFTAELYFGTVTNDYANTDSVGMEGGGGVWSAGNALFLKNSIVANNVVYGITYGRDLRGVFNSENYNHFGAPDGGFSFVTAQPNDTYGAAALAPLQNNGGPTLTHTPNNYGPIVDQIPNGVNGCGSSLPDQRGVARPAYLKCDKGAVEWWYIT